MQLVLGKQKMEMIEFTENDCLPNFKFNFDFLESF